MLNRFKASVYLQLFVLLNLAYLIIDLSFNARLLDLSLSSQLNYRFDKLELYGRAISSIGATLVAWRWLVPFHPERSLSQYLIRFALIAALVFPTVFVAQKKLIDSLVDHSSAEARRTAQQLSLLKYGLLHDFIQLDELPAEAEAWKTAEGRMLVSLAGPVLAESAHMRTQLEQNLPIIAERAVATQENQQANEWFNAYRFVRQQATEQYTQYRALVLEFEQARRLSLEQANADFEQAVQSALQQWELYEHEYQTLQTRLQAREAKLQALWQSPAVQKTRCSSAGRRTEANLRNDEFIRLLGFVPQTWPNCQVARNATDTPASNDPPISAWFSLWASEQAALAVGLEVSKSYRLAYLNSESFRQRVLNSLRFTGYQLGDEWRLQQHESLVNELQNQHLQRLEQRYHNQVMSRWQETIPKRLDFDRFSQTRLVQEPLQQLLGRIDLPPVPLHWEREQFVKQLIEPGHEAALQNLLRKLEAPAHWFEEGAPYEQTGKNAVRNLLIPPLVLSISLLVILLNLINLCFGLVFLIVRPNWGRRIAVSLVLLSSLVLLPWAKHYPLTGHEGFGHLVREINQDMPYASPALLWLVRAESLVYPYGNILRFGLLNGFEFE